jgi:hypothetical protein
VVGKYPRTHCGKASRLDALTFKIQNAYGPVLPVFKTAERDERHGTRNTSKDKRIDVEASRHFTIACHEHPLPERANNAKLRESSGFGAPLILAGRERIGMIAGRKASIITDDD